ncbi:Transcriptional regulator of nonfermentable carbon utilization, partial [Gryganskiella cystojenkinii]
MAATATISTSKTHPVVGRSTMNLVGAAGPLCSPPPSPELACTPPVLNNSSSGGSIIPTAGSTTGATPKPHLNASSSASKAVSTFAPVTNSATVTACPVAATAPAALLSENPSASVPVSYTVNPSSTTASSKTITNTTTTSTAANLGAGHPKTTSTLLTSSVSAKPVVTKPTAVVATAPTPAVAPSSSTSRSGEATTFFDDMINAPQPPANILTLSSTTLLPDLYHDFFDNHPELYDSDQSSDPEMDLDLEDDCSPAVIRARAMEDIRQTTASTIAAPLIADRPKLETIDTINLVLHRRPVAQNNNSNGNNCGGQVSSDDCSSGQSRKKKANRACSHCQKAHLTCDDSRPCQRCVKRDLAGSCADGIRKKAKYLQGTVEAAQQQAAEMARLEQEQEQNKRANSIE